MDNRAELTEQYNLFISSLYPQNLIRNVIGIPQDNGTSKLLDAKSKTLTPLIKFTSLLDDNLEKYVAFQRVKRDLDNALEVHEIILKKDLGLDGFTRLEKVHNIKISIDKTEQNWNEISVRVRLFINSLMRDILDMWGDFEFGLIGATNISKRTKPTKETRLELNQKQICGLFIGLKELKLIKSITNTELGSHLSHLVIGEPEQIRQALSKPLTQKDKDTIVKQLVKLIENIDDKLRNKVSIQK